MSLEYEKKRAMMYNCYPEAWKFVREEDDELRAMDLLTKLSFQTVAVDTSLGADS
jgi:hypothetical protein